MTDATGDGQIGHFEREFVEELECLSKLSDENEKLKAQVSSLTKKREELESKIDPNEYYPTKCNDCGWEGSSKFVRVFYYHDDCDVSCPCCHSNDLVDLEKEISDELSIQNLTFFIDKQESELTEKISDLQSQLSNREKEIEELKENFDKTEFFYFVEDEEQLGSPDDVAEYWDCPIGGTLDIQSCKVFFQPTQTYIRTEKGMVPVQSKEGEEE